MKDLEARFIKYNAYGGWEEHFILLKCCEWPIASVGASPMIGAMLRMPKPKEYFQHVVLMLIRVMTRLPV